MNEDVTKLRELLNLALSLPNQDQTRTNKLFAALIIDLSKGLLKLENRIYGLEAK